METLQLILICAGILVLCVAGMAINLLVKKNGKFPDTEIGSNPNMRKLGLTCAKQEEILLWKKHKKGDVVSDGCASCSCMGSCDVEEVKKKKK